MLNVQSVGADSEGVFSAYADIVYNEDAASVAGDIVHSSTYGNGTFSDISVAGLINEAGGTDGLQELGDGVFEVLRVPMQIANLPVGTVVEFDTNDSDAASIRATTAFGNNEEISPNDQTYSGTSVMIAAVDEVMAEE